MTTPNNDSKYTSDSIDAFVDFAKSIVDADNIKYDGTFPSDYEAEFAKKLYSEALQAAGGDTKLATTTMHNVMKGNYGTEIKNHYMKFVDSKDGSAGWDKVMHFIAAANITHDQGKLAADAAGWGKELWDSVEGVFGFDPEGFSREDIHSDNLGEFFGLSLYYQKIITAWLSSRFKASPPWTFQVGAIATSGSLCFCMIHGFCIVTSGSSSLNISGHQAARVGDVTTCGATIISGGSRWAVNGAPIAAVGDQISHGGFILTGIAVCIDYQH
ncbi:PAAR domain-containing protein [Myxococcota bacterium]|jgi:uncharacterized Zn-binding protein involved in type VI secretion|nr:PAAR domain-containing protein [Myxococcota bacterium]